MGRGHEPLIKIELGNYTKKIEERIRANPDLMKRFRGNNDNDNNQINGGINSEEQKIDNDYNHEFSSDTSTSLLNIFNSKSVVCIKITSAVFFLIVLFVTSLEFIFTFLNIQNIKKEIETMNKSYKLLTNIGFTKYFITEAILSNQIENYIKRELAYYREEFSNIYGEFSSTSTNFFFKKL